MKGGEDVEMRESCGEFGRNMDRKRKSDWNRNMKPKGREKREIDG